MAIGDITFVKGQGGLGRPLTGQDHISGLLFYTANGNLPSGFNTTSRIKAFTSVADAEKAGIKADYNDATAATFTYQITTAGSTGDTINIAVTEMPKLVNGEYVANVVNLCTYAKKSSDSTTTIMAASVVAAINAGTLTHGYSATNSSNTITITAPKRLGIYINSGTPVVVTLTGTIAGTLTQPSGGVASNQAVWHYHIAEFFRMQPKGVLYVGFFAVPSPYTFVEITTMQNFANGKIRQLGVFKDSAAFATADLTAIRNEVVTNCDANKKPLSVLYGANLAATSDLTTLTDLNALNAEKASAVISQDGAGLGYQLWLATGKSVTTLGAHLGAVAFAAVNNSIKWVGKFDFSSGVELDTPAFANGTLVSSCSQSLLDLVDSYRYLFLTKKVGKAGTYANDSHTAVIATSDYAYIENCRTIDKAIRGIYSSLLDDLGRDLVLNSDGTLADTTIAHLESQAELNLRQMVRDGELSAYSVAIDPTQNVLSTNKLVVAVQLLPIGVARAIQVNIGYTLSLS